MPKMIFTDIETTGLTVGKHAIIQIACLKVENMEIINTFNIRVRPFGGSLVSPKALECNKIPLEDLYSNDRKEYKDAMNEFLNFSEINGFVSYDKRVYFAGFNSIVFDFPHLEFMANYCNVSYFFKKFYWPGIDVSVLACDKLMHCRKEFTTFKLSDIAKYYNIAIENAHDALSDIMVTFEIYKKLKTL